MEDQVGAVSLSDEKTYRAEYPAGRLGDWVERAAHAVLEMMPAAGMSGWGPWTALSLPGSRSGLQAEVADYAFFARCPYRGGEPGWVMLAVVEERVGIADPPFQQTFVGFVDCCREPPPVADPFDLFDLEKRRAFERRPMWTVESEHVVGMTLPGLRRAWAARWEGHPAPALQMIAGRWLHRPPA